ncbi:MAG: helix-turn-helix transcriptional regulator [Alteromonadaceae bacterium]|nr:helix-turn-helix transcriptional regulator [Alteromonadaceae bacterium]
MILAEKIVQLRKKVGWSQEELAEKMNISRQSVSKWESANSIPDLNKIIMLAEIFSVSTDFLLKDDIETIDVLNEDTEAGVNQINLEQALNYINNKAKVANLTTKGVIFCLCSVMPLFLFLAMAKANQLNITSSIATALGVVAILIMISIGVSFFIRTNHYESDLSAIENENFELAYGVHSIIKEQLQKFRRTYNLRLSISIFLFIISFAPMMFTSIFIDGSDMHLLMLIVMFIIIAIGIYILTPVSSKYDAYNRILKEGDLNTTKSKRTKRAEKLAAFYWPLLTAIYLGWSLWTMSWGVTWIMWPVGAVFFAALVGLMELLNKEEV